MASQRHSVETPLERVLAALRAHGENPKRSGDGFVSRCPSHEDRNPSLSISEGREGAAVVNCHAGCSAERVLDVIGLRMADLFPPRDEPLERPKRRIVKEYSYTDEHGVELYQKIRYEPKDFRQRRPDGKGGWIYKLGDTRQVLYNLPHVLWAIEHRQTVYLVEGEKDADALCDIDPSIVATTSPLGAGKWRPEFTAQLAGANVVVIADRDEPGRAHARMVADALRADGGTPTVLEPATGKDVSDHLAEGLTLEQLVPMADDQDTPADRFSFETWEQFRDHTDENIDYLVGGLIPQGSLVFLASQPKAGKTWLALSLAVSVATGSQYLEKFEITTPSRVLYLALEGHRTDYRTRLGAIANGHGVNPSGRGLANLTLSYQPIGLDLMDDAWTKDLLAAALEREARIVFVDVLRNGAPRLREDGKGSEDFSVIRTHLQPLLKAGVTVVLVHHFTKTGDGTRKRSIGEMMSGSGALFGSADLIIGITTPPKEWENMRVEFIGRSAPAPDPFRVQIVGSRTGKYGGFCYSDALALSTLHQDDATGEPAKRVWHHAAPMAAWIRQQGRRVSTADLVDEFGVAKSTIHDHIGDLAEEGIEHIFDLNNNRLSGFEATR